MIQSFSVVRTASSTMDSGTLMKVSKGNKESLDLTPIPIYSADRRFLGRNRAQQLAAGDSPDPSPSGGRFGGGRTGDPRIQACI